MYRNKSKNKDIFNVRPTRSNVFVTTLLLPKRLFGSSEKYNSTTFSRLLFYKKRLPLKWLFFN